MVTVHSEHANNGEAGTMLIWSMVTHLRVALQDPDQVAGVRVPYPDGLICGARRQQGAVGAELDADDAAGVARQRPLQLVPARGASSASRLTPARIYSKADCSCAPAVSTKAAGAHDMPP